jgi:hypothetical protein
MPSGAIVLLGSRLRLARIFPSLWTIFIHALAMADNAWRYSGTVVLSKSAWHSSTRRLHSAMVSPCVDEIVIRVSFVSEGPTTRGRIHFSRALDAQDAAWCAHILTAKAVVDQPVSRAEAETLFEINAAASERSDNGQFDDLFAKAIVHHAASASGFPVPSRTIALSPDTAIESWAPTRATDLDEASCSHYRRGHTAADAASEPVRHEHVSRLYTPDIEGGGVPKQVYNQADDEPDKITRPTTPSSGLIERS